MRPRHGLRQEKVGLVFRGLGGAAFIDGNVDFPERRRDLWRLVFHGAQDFYSVTPIRHSGEGWLCLLSHKNPELL